MSKTSRVKAIRRGKPIPAGYLLVGQKVDVARSAKTRVQQASGTVYAVCR
jgi:hypothetical protein